MEGSGTTPPEGTQPEKEPTIADVMAIAQKAAADAAEAKNAAEAQSSIERTVKEEGAARGFALSDEDVEKIGAGVISQLEARGAFEDHPSSPPPPAAPAAGGTGAQPAAGTPAEGGSAPPPPAPPSEPSPPTPSGDAKPEKKTFAERFMGR